MGFAAASLQVILIVSLLASASTPFAPASWSTFQISAKVGHIIAQVMFESNEKSPLFWNSLMWIF
jgi:hypothetical protein